MDLRLLDFPMSPLLKGSYVGKECRSNWTKAGIALLLALLMPVLARAGDKTTVDPADTVGTLIIVGGGRLPDVIRQHFLRLAGNKKARIVVIPTASTKADQGDTFPTYLAFKSQDVRSVSLFHTRDRKKANDPEFLRPLTQATGVWLTGGDQSRLSEVYHGTAVERELRKVLDRGGVVGGTSAGAAVMSSLMITGGTQEAQLGTGFGLLSGVVIDQHFQNRHRMPRLLGVLDKHPECPGVGIDEETALVVHGQTATVEGNGNVYACLCARGKEPQNVRTLKDGDNLDISALIKQANSRVKTTIAETKHPVVPEVASTRTIP
jgi:cyanophycinase